MQSFILAGVVIMRVSFVQSSPISEIKGSMGDSVFDSCVQIMISQGPRVYSLERVSLRGPIISHRHVCLFTLHPIASRHIQPGLARQIIPAVTEQLLCLSSRWSRGSECVRPNRGREYLGSTRINRSS